MKRSRSVKTAAIAALLAVGAMPFGAALAQEAPQWSQVETATPPAARHENAAAWIGDRLYLVGGRGDRPLDIYDSQTGTWTQGAEPPGEIHHTQAAIRHGKLYLIGVLTGAFPQEPALPHIMIYDPQADSWTLGSPIPIARRRGGGGLVFHDGLFYLIAGTTRGHMGGYVPWMDVFDPETGEWRELPDAPRPRDHFQATVLDGRIYLAGGRTSSHETGQVDTLSVPEVDVYDIGSGSWSTLKDPLPTPRSGTTTVTWQDTIVVLGGESGTQSRAHDEVEAYSPREDRWTALPSLPIGRHGTQAVVADGALHIVAGSRDRGGGPELDDHWVLSPAATQNP